MPRRTSGLTRLLRRLRGAPAADTASTDQPCVPCGKQNAVRQFSLNPEPAAQITDTDVPRPAPGVVDTILEDHVVVLHPGNDATHVLNTTAALIWLTIDGSMDLATIIDDLAAEAGVHPEVITADVRNTLSRFVDAGIVTLDAPEGATPTDEHDPGRASADGRTPRRPSQMVEHVLDRVEWTTVIGPVQAAGAAVVVRTNDPDVGSALEAALAELPPGKVPPGEAAPVVVSAIDTGKDGHRRHRLYVDGQRRWQAATADLVAPMITSELNQIAVDETHGRILLHAGAVERDGRVIVVAGDSGQGKSTLTAALAQRGFAYLTDEIAAVDPDTLDVLTYPKAIDLDERSLDLLGIEATDTDTGADRAAQKARIAPRRLGDVSSGGRLALFVLLTDPSTESAQPDDDSAQPDDHAAAPPEAVRTLVDLLGTVFRPSFEDPSTLHALANLDERVALLRLPRLPLHEACASVAVALDQREPTDAEPLLLVDAPER